jgi:hypothetical protein
MLKEEKCYYLHSGRFVEQCDPQRDCEKVCSPSIYLVGYEKSTIVIELYARYKDEHYFCIDSQISTDIFLKEELRC